MSNRISRRHWLAVFLAGSTAPVWALNATAKPAADGPPAAPVEPVADNYFGTEVVDPYRWMEARPRSERWDVWLKGQGDYARRQLDRLPPRASMLRRIEHYTGDLDQLAMATPAGGKLFLLMRPAGANSVQLFVRDTPDSPRRLLLDPSVGAAAGAPTRALDWHIPSPTGRHVAYGLSEGGSERSTLYICDVASGKSTEITRVISRGAGWSADGSGFFSYRLRADAVPGAPDFGMGGACWLHRLGTDPSSDQKVFSSGEGPDFETMEDDAPFVDGAPGSSWVLGRHLLNGNDLAQLYIARADDLLAGRAQWRKLAGRSAGVQMALLHGDSVYILAHGRSDKGEVVKVDAVSGDFNSGKVVLPASAQVIDFMAAARDGVYVHDITEGLGGLRRIDYQDRVERVQLTRTGAVWSIATAVDEDGAWFHMDELTWPAESFHVDAARLAARQVMLVRAPSFKTNDFVTTRLHAPARDGASIALEILHRKSTRLNGRNPLLLIAYGAYGTIMDPGFQPAKLAFLDAGGVLVYAHVRGGGEQGEDWHRAGMKATKPNSWRDVIDCAEHLVKLRWTGKGHMALWGTSAGGIVAGRAITERPELFSAVIGEVGVFNTLRFELTSNGPGNDAEFGTVKKEDEFKALLAMDSYHAVRDGVRYPAALIITGANDLRVEPWVPGKFAARLQAATTSGKQVLLRVDYDAGHFSNSRKAANALSADILSFVLAHTI
ncbi:prolyl oligopeptidase family serine peptidase [Rugamonas rivuli]|uniref:prolyl oligopeptidase n=1 Tax=Rugamonas rivuli TaxID=2743358 RepID=A0A843SIT5_9BURK|nr:prolyl oligopeptidase family serine peptidase [Rugamonas rivuli]MQA21874.1 prolyl oligopeptidase family serine peptidase [Rugamonas rivuli]